MRKAVWLWCTSVPLVFGGLYLLFINRSDIITLLGVIGVAFGITRTVLDFLPAMRNEAGKMVPGQQMFWVKNLVGAAGFLTVVSALSVTVLLFLNLLGV